MNENAREHSKLPQRPAVSTCQLGNWRLAQSLGLPSVGSPLAEGPALPGICPNRQLAVERDPSMRNSRSSRELPNMIGLDTPLRFKNDAPALSYTVRGSTLVGAQLAEWLGQKRGAW